MTLKNVNIISPDHGCPHYAENNSRKRKSYNNVNKVMHFKRPIIQVQNVKQGTQKNIPSLLKTVMIENISERERRVLTEHSTNIVRRITLPSFIIHVHLLPGWNVK